MVTGSSRALGSFDARVGGPLGPLHWQVIGSVMQRRGSPTTFPAVGPEPLPADLDREERQSAYWKVSGQNWSGVGGAVSRTQRLSSAPFGGTLGSPLNLYRNRVLFGDVRYEPTLGGVETLFRLFGDRNEFSANEDYTMGRAAGSSGVFREWDPDRSLGAEVQARFHLSEKLLVTLGSEYAAHRYDGLAGIPAAQVATRVGFVLGSSYLQADWTLNEVLSCTVGLQDSQWRVDRAQSIAGGQVTELDRKALRGLTPRAAIIWLPTALDIVKWLYGEGYRNPTIFERYYGDGESYKADPLLKPERITTVQGIWVHVWNDGLQSQLSYAQSTWKNLIHTESIQVGDQSLQQFQNDAAPIQGRSLEGELKGRWSGWDVYAQAGFYRWTQRSVSLSNVAGFQAALRATRRWRDWSASAEVRHVGGRENLDAQAGGAVPSSTTLRLTARWQPSRYWLSATLQDATHARPWNLVATEYAPITSMREDGRTCLLNAGLRF